MWSLPAEDIAACSCAALDREVDAAELVVIAPSTSAVLLGAFQREHETAGAWGAEPRARRGSGGGAVRVGPGVLYVGLLLPHPGALAPANEAQILNRAVRPMLRALTKTGVLTHYFGRDFLSAKKHPVASVSYGHDARTRRTLVETFVSVTALAQLPRASFEGKSPATLADLRGAPIDLGALATRIAEEHGLPLAAPAGVGARTLEAAAPPWTARVDEAIGPLHAGFDHAGHLRLGGELMASRDRIVWLEERAAHAAEDTLDALVDEALAAPGVALFGVKSLRSVRDVLLAARAARR